MRSTSKRLDNVESSLSPKQAVLLWMEEAHQHPTMQEYVLSLRDQPDSAYPLHRLPDQVETSVRDSMKGSHKSEVTRAVRDQVRDVVFLFFVHQGANKKLMENERAFALQEMMLSSELRWLDDQRRFHRESKPRRNFHVNTMRP